MPNNNVSDSITDQEIAFARLILSGAMTDRRAAEAVGLNPGTAAYTKAKPRVRDYMLEHRAAVRQQFVQQEADGLHRLTPDREQVLARLWEIANLSPEMTRGSITGQVKVLSMIVAMQNFIPDPRAVAAEKKSAPPPAPQIYTSAWLRRQQAAAIDSQPSPVPAQEEARQVDSPGVPEPDPAPASAAEVPADSAPSQSTFANRFTPSEAPEPYVPLFPPVTGTRVGFSVRKNPFARRPR